MWPFKAEELFDLNDEVDVEFVPIEGSGSGVVVVQDIYEQPDQVRKLVMNAPAPGWKAHPDGGNFKRYYDCRSRMLLAHPQIQLLIRQLADDLLNIDVEKPTMEFSANLFRLIEDQPENTTAYPHTDGVVIAGLVSFNTPEECSGGTAFYRHKPSGRYHMPTDAEELDRLQQVLFAEEREDGLSYFLEYQRNWEVVKMVPMKYNQLIIWPGVMFHGAWHEHNSFKDHWRINQTILNPHVKYRW